MSDDLDAVTNASPLIFLAKLGDLELLPEEVATTPLVLEEVHAGDPKDHPEVDLIDTVVDQGRIRSIEAEPSQLPREVAGLHEGEASVLALARERDVSEVIVDDRVAIRTAKALGLSPVSTPFLLLRATRQGALTTDGFERRLDQLLEHGYHLSPRLYRRLREAAEQ